MEVQNPTLQHKERLLRKVKLNNNGTATVEWRDYYVNPETGQRSHNDVDNNADDAMIHEDFKAAFAKLDEHWMIRGNEVPEPKGNYAFDGSLKGLDKVTVTSVTFSGGEPTDPDSGEERTPVGAHIQGTMKLSGGGVKNYCLPAIKMGAPQEKYKFSTHLDEHLQVVEQEAYAYVAGKCTPPAQTSLNLEAHNPEDGSAIADPVETEEGVGGGMRRVD